MCICVGWKYHGIFSIWDYSQSFPNTRLEVYQMAPGQCFKVYIYISSNTLFTWTADCGCAGWKARNARKQEAGGSGGRRGGGGVILLLFIGMKHSPMKRKKLGVSISRVAAQSRSFSQKLTSHSCVSCTGPGQVFSQGISSESFRWYLSPQV